MQCRLLMTPYLIEERILNYGEVSVRADRTQVEDGHSAARYIQGIVQL
jgi:hypothetical protein